MFPLIFFLQLQGPATALSRKFLHGLTTVQHFKSFCNMHNKKILAGRQQFSVRGAISVTAGPRTRAA
jgi:hypothetical protein